MKLTGKNGILRIYDGTSQYFEVMFSNMDFKGPYGRPSNDEILILDRQIINSHSHYISGNDLLIYKPIIISGTCALDDTLNYISLFEAMSCGNPNTTYWTINGTTTKGTTQNNGINNNPSFEDSNKKTVDIKILWSGDTDWGMAYYEVYFLDNEQTIKENKNGVDVSFSGACYGIIESITSF